MVTDFKNPKNELKLKNVLRASFRKLIYDLQHNKMNIIKSNESHNLRLYTTGFQISLNVSYSWSQRFVMYMIIYMSIQQIPFKNLFSQKWNATGLIKW